MTSILISSCRGGIACEICIESILKRTKETPYKIVVFDSTGPSPELDYLQEQQLRGNIELITEPTPKLHGYAIERLLGMCDTKFAFILDSDVEIIDGNWLGNTARFIQADRDLVVTQFRSGSFSFGMPETAFAPTFWPAHMLLNMDAYRNLGFTGSWIAKHVSIEGYRYRSELGGKDTGEKFIYYDTGSQLTEKVLYESPGVYNAILLPRDFWHSQMTHYGGISSNWPAIKPPRIAHKLEAMKERLDKLRNE